MSLYRLQRRMFDDLRGVPSGFGPPGWQGGDGLTDDERRALRERDVAALYRMGVHPVLLNGYCRAAGLGRNDYRTLLEPFDDGVRRRTRWRPS
jgi:hypothetical protein